MTACLSLYAYNAIYYLLQKMLKNDRTNCGGLTTINLILVSIYRYFSRKHPTAISAMPRANHHTIGGRIRASRINTPAPIMYKPIGLEHLNLLLIAKPPFAYLLITVYARAVHSVRSISDFPNRGAFLQGRKGGRSYHAATC